jgi:hypothetical protein
MVDDQHAQAALSGDDGAHQPGRAGADHDGVEPRHRYTLLTR